MSDYAHVYEWLRQQPGTSRDFVSVPVESLDSLLGGLTPVAVHELVRESGITVAELKQHIADWPETDASGEPTEVWVETGLMQSGPCLSVEMLNLRIRDDGTHTSDLLFCPARSAWVQETGGGPPGGAESPKLCSAGSIPAPPASTGSPLAEVIRGLVENRAELLRARNALLGDPSQCGWRILWETLTQEFNNLGKRIDVLLALPASTAGDSPVDAPP